MKGLWPRAAELLLGIWLLVAPLVFPDAGVASWLVSPGAGLLVIATVVVSLLPSLGRVHLATLPVALGLIAWSWAAFDRPGPPGAQNLIVVGLLLGLLAVVPSDALSPPAAWRPWVEGEDEASEPPTSPA